MKRFALVAGTIVAALTAAHAKPSPAPAWGQQWQQPASPAAPAPRRRHAGHHRHHFDRAGPAPSNVAERRIVGALQAELAQMRRELDDVRSRTMPRPQWTAADVWPPDGRRAAFGSPVEAPQALASLPDLRLPGQAPANPAPPLAAVTGIEAVDRARAYLIQTATAGATMIRQGISLAIERLHPAFVERLERAIRDAREAGLVRAGVFSAYRPPAFGVGGFKNKFNSMHAYGLAVDMTGIGGPGSAAARLWQKIVMADGLFLPYGPNNRAEFNHTQLLPQKVATRQMRATITAGSPKDVRTMWLASGVKVDLPVAPPINSARLLPEIDWSQSQ